MKRLALLALALAGCAGGPLPPDWQTNARQALESFKRDYLAGDTRKVIALERFEEIGRAHV